VGEASGPTLFMLSWEWGLLPGGCTGERIRECATGGGAGLFSPAAESSAFGGVEVFSTAQLSSSDGLAQRAEIIEPVPVVCCVPPEVIIITAFETTTRAGNWTAVVMSAATPLRGLST